jgi:hypothetical protein
MSNLRRIMWNETVRALPLAQQLRAARIAGCEALSVTPSDYVTWLAHRISTRDMTAMAADAGVILTHLDPLVRWIDAWQPQLPGGEVFPVDTVGFDPDDFFRIANALGVRSFTAWAGFPQGRYTLQQIVDAFETLCRRAAQEGLRCDLEFMPVFGIPDLRSAWMIISPAMRPTAASCSASGIMSEAGQTRRSWPPSRASVSPRSNPAMRPWYCPRERLSHPTA